MSKRKRKSKKEIHSDMIKDYHKQNIKYASLLEERNSSQFTPNVEVRYRSNIPKGYRQSIGESLIQEELISKKIHFLKEVEFNDCRNPTTKKKLRFDFYLPDKNVCVEFDGIQHFEYVEKFDGIDKNLVNIRKSIDLVKNRYCLKKGIRLLRIRYDEIDKVKDLNKLINE